LAYLVSQGIEKSRLQVIAKGSKEPIWKKEKEAWQAQENRRIEVVIWD
jgi:outer membrane protein OmpA-like peptidoglycan-associated protein